MRIHHPSSVGGAFLVVGMVMATILNQVPGTVPSPNKTMPTAALVSVAADGIATNTGVTPAILEQIQGLVGVQPLSVSGALSDAFHTFEDRFVFVCLCVCASVCLCVFVCVCAPVSVSIVPVYLVALNTPASYHPSFFFSVSNTLTTCGTRPFHPSPRASLTPSLLCTLPPTTCPPGQILMLQNAGVCV